MSVNYDTDTQSIYGFELTMLNRTNSIVSRSECRSRTESVTARKEPSKLWMSAQSLKSIQNDNNYKELVPEKPYEENGEVEKDKSQNGFLQTIINLFDLSLLKDLTFVNIMCGISLATFAELNFTMLTPFILSDLGIVTSTAGIATFMSSLASADIVFRFLSPYIGSYLKKSPRGMYLLSMMMLVIFRYVLLFAPNYNFVMGVGVALGIAKGLRTVYVSMVIPAHVPIERLAAASGLQMMVNGCLFLLCGPVMGIIKDITGKYSKCVYALNTVTLITVTMWTAELIYKAMRKKEKNVPVEMA